MFQKTLGRWLWFGLVLVLSGPDVRPNVTTGEDFQVTVSVHNDAEIPGDILQRAEMEASRVFRQSGLELRWLNCPLPPTGSENPLECAVADFPRHFQLHIASRPVGLSEHAMGVSYLSADGIGCYTDVFFAHAQLIHEISHVNVAIILGHGVAHEIGHLLLGTNSHAPSGIMRARWESGDLVSASKGMLLFSRAESRQMRNKLVAWQLQARNSEPVLHLPSAVGVPDVSPARKGWEW